MADFDFQTTNPFTEEPITSYSYFSNDDASAIVQRSHEAHLEWRLRSLDERAAVIAAIGKGLREKKEEFAQLMTREVGKLIKDSRDEIELCAGICVYTRERPEISRR